MGWASSGPVYLRPGISPLERALSAPRTAAPPISGHSSCCAAILLASSVMTGSSFRGGWWLWALLGCIGCRGCPGRPRDCETAGIATRDASAVLQSSEPHSSGEVWATPCSHTKL